MKRTPLARKSPLKAKTPLRARAPMRRARPKSTPARQAARGKPCMLNVAGVCNYNAETTVLAHFRFLGNCGTGIKPSDLQGCPACSSCNTWTDSPTPRQVEACGGRVGYERDRAIYAARALTRLRHIDHEGKAA